MSITDLNNLMPTLLATPKEAVKEPSMPVNVYIQEADNQYDYCQPDKEKLALRGITDEKIESIKPLSGALQQAQSNWQAERDKKEQAVLEWREKSKPARALRNQILHDFHYAYRERDDVLRQLRRIGDGSSHADMIQDLSDLPTIGRANPEELAAMTFPMELLDEAEESASTLGFIYSASTAAGNNNEVKDIRDRAFTALKVVIDDIRAAGQNLFWKEPEKLINYRSEYLRKHNQSRRDEDNDNNIAA